MGRIFPLPKRVDIAYKLKENNWNGETNIEIEIIGIRLPLLETNSKPVMFEYQGKKYWCNFSSINNELKIKNEQGKVLAVTKGQRKGLLGTNRETAKEVDITQPHYYQLIKAAMGILGLSK